MLHFDIFEKFRNIFLKKWLFLREMIDIHVCAFEYHVKNLFLSLKFIFDKIKSWTGPNLLPLLRINFKERIFHSIADSQQHIAFDQSNF